jgi:hypothetical protein
LVILTNGARWLVNLLDRLARACYRLAQDKKTDGLMQPMFSLTETTTMMTTMIMTTGKTGRAASTRRNG